MSVITPNMGLTAWTSINDLFNHVELADNFDAIDAHDHTSGKGVPLGPGSVGSTALIDNSVTTDKIANLNVIEDKLAANSVTNSKVGTSAITADKIGILPSVRAFHSEAQSIPHENQTSLAFDSERFDNDSMHSASTSSPQLVFNTAGIYYITGNVEWESNSTGVRNLSIRKNGTTIIARDSLAGSTSAAPIQSINTMYKFIESDYVELVVHQTSGDALDIIKSDEYSPEFSATYLHKG